MQRLKRVFNINIETCERCGGQVKVIASIEAPAVLAHILKHLKQKEALQAGIQPYELGRKLIRAKSQQQRVVRQRGTSRDIGKFEGTTGTSP